MNEGSKIDSEPEDGCYVHGMYLQGGKWDSKQMKFIKLNENEIQFEKMPIIHFMPT